jgi:probable phosphoglycerate mutase
VVVHPEATHHVEGLVGGWHDSDLTTVGVRDALAIAAAIRAEIPCGASADVSSSDLIRASRTAEAIAAPLGVVPVLDRRLREKSYGVAEGRPREWLERRFLPPPAAGDRMSHDEGIDGAETKWAFAERIYDVMDDVLARPAEWQVIVTHGFALTFIVAAWIRMPIESLGDVNFHAEPGSVTTLHEDDFFHNRQLVRLGDTRHLK